MGAHYNRLIEKILMNTHNIDIYEHFVDKNYLQLSSITHIISSSGICKSQNAHPHSILMTIEWFSCVITNAK